MSEEDVAVAAKLAGIEIDPAYLPGVARTLAVVLGQAALLYEHRLSALVEPAPVFRS
ncbi:MAG: DUF4089 domain-containing protein [Novosphingobium sp.]